MAIWRLRTLGIFTLTHASEADTNTSDAPLLRTGFKNYRTWILLACLATDPSTCQRAEIAKRLWEETDTLYDESDYLTKLRPLLTDLVHGDKKNELFGIGEECLIRSQKTIRLQPGTVITDIAEVEAMMRAVPAMPDDRQRIAALRAAARLLHGTFLPGFDPPPSALAWYNTQLVYIEALRGIVWYALLEVAEKTGDTATRAEAWQYIQGLVDSEDFAVPNLSRRQLSKNTRKDALPIAWAALAEHLEQKEKEGLPLTISEEGALETALEATLTQLPTQDVIAFRALSVFPQPFTRQQATAIAAIRPGETQKLLDRLVEAALLHLVPQTQEPNQDRYQLPPFVGSLVFQKLHNSQRKRFRLRHAQHFANFNGTDWQINKARREMIVHRFHDDQANYLQALDVCLENPWSNQAWDFLDCLCLGATQTASDENILLRRNILQRAIPRLREAAESGQSFRYSPADWLMSAAQEKNNFPEAVHWASIALKHRQSNTAIQNRSTENRTAVRQLSETLAELLGIIHHSGHHEEFDKAFAVAWEVLDGMAEDDLVETDEEPTSKLTKLMFQRRLHFIRAENLWARCDCVAALQASKACLKDTRAIAVVAPSLAVYFPASHYQMGCIQWELGQQGEALTSWNRALEGFQAQGERHGIADCKKRIGRALAEMGQLAIAQDVIQDAISIYTAQGKPHSRAAALGTLADVLVMKGEASKAIASYEEALALSRDAQHAGWVTHIELSLKRLKQSY